MKRNAFLCLLMIVAPLSVIAQSFNGAKLKGGVWYRNEVDKKEKITMVFTDTQFSLTYSECTFGPWVSESHSFPYYLSDTVPTEFDNTKVGKSTKGKYLIWINLLDYRFYAETITELTDNSFKIINPVNLKETYTKKAK